MKEGFLIPRVGSRAVRKIAPARGRLAQALLRRGVHALPIAVTPAGNPALPDLQEAQMAGASFIGCAMDGVRMRGAHLVGAVFDKGTTLVGADLCFAFLLHQPGGLDQVRTQIVEPGQVENHAIGDLRVNPCKHNAIGHPFLVRQHRNRCRRWPEPAGWTV